VWVRFPPPAPFPNKYESFCLDQLDVRVFGLFFWTLDPQSDVSLTATDRLTASFLARSYSSGRFPTNFFFNSATLVSSRTALLDDFFFRR
jgi:hypothetical protein